LTFVIAMNLKLITVYKQIEIRTVCHSFSLAKLRKQPHFNAIVYHIVNG
jgi:hypothetical protein